MCISTTLPRLRRPCSTIGNFKWIPLALRKAVTTLEVYTTVLVNYYNWKLRRIEKVFLVATDDIMIRM